MPVITGICTKWLKNSQQNFSPLRVFPSQGLEGRKRKVAALDARDTQSPTTVPEVKQQLGNKAVNPAEGRQGSPGPLGPFPHSRSVPLQSTALSGPSKSHPDYRTEQSHKEQF